VYESEISTTFSRYNSVKSWTPQKVSTVRRGCVTGEN
jgi:hypothetical protein